MHKPLTMAACAGTVLAICIPYLVLFGSEPLVHSIFGLKLIPSVVLAFGLVSAVWKDLFQMGLKDMKSSNVAFKLLPLVYLIGLSAGVVFTIQTYATAFIISMFWGVGLSYLGRVLFIK